MIRFCTRAALFAVVAMALGVTACDTGPGKGSTSPTKPAPPPTEKEQGPPPPPTLPNKP